MLLRSRPRLCLSDETHFYFTFPSTPPFPITIDHNLNLPRRIHSIFIYSFLGLWRNCHWPTWGSSFNDQILKRVSLFSLLFFYWTIPSHPWIFLGSRAVIPDWLWHHRETFKGKINGSPRFDIWVWWKFESEKLRTWDSIVWYGCIRDLYVIKGEKFGCVNNWYVMIRKKRFVLLFYFFLFGDCGSCTSFSI